MTDLLVGEQAGSKTAGLSRQATAEHRCVFDKMQFALAMVSSYGRSTMLTVIVE